MIGVHEKCFTNKVWFDTVKTSSFILLIKMISIH